MKRSAQVWLLNPHQHRSLFRSSVPRAAKGSPTSKTILGNLGLQLKLPAFLHYSFASEDEQARAIAFTELAFVKPTSTFCHRTFTLWRLLKLSDGENAGNKCGGCCLPNKFLRRKASGPHRPDTTECSLRIRIYFLSPRDDALNPSLRGKWCGFV